MRLRFEDPIDDEDEFAETSEVLLGELDAWAHDRFADEDGLRAGYAQTFLQWKYGYGDGLLDQVTRRDIDEYLLRWCPRKVSGPSDTADHLVTGLSAYVEFMASTSRLVGGVGRAAELMVLLEDMRDEARDAMGDRTKFGMGKALLSVPLEGPTGDALASLLAFDDMPEDQLQAMLDERMAAFNALPIEQRRAITDGIAPQVRRVDLGFVHVPPPSDAVEAAAVASRLLQMVDGLVDWLGPIGRAVTGTGAIRLNDARELIELLGTGDDPDHDVMGMPRSLKSSRDLPTLLLVVSAAEASGAVTVERSKMRPDPAWSTMDVVARAGAVVEALMMMGPLSHSGIGNGIHQAIDELLDGGIVHWLVNALPAGSVEELDVVVEYAVSVADQEFGVVRGAWGAPSFDGIITRSVHTIFDALELAGLVEIDGRRTTTDTYGFTDRHGGTFTATALLRHLMPRYAREAGFDFREMADLATAATDVVVEAVAAGDATVAAAAEQWRSEVPVKERIAALADVAARTDRPLIRVASFALIDGYGAAAVAEPYVRQLLDSPAVSHAALFLLQHELATHEDLDGFSIVGVVVDHLAVLLDDPERMAELFEELQARTVDDLFDDLWRHDQPETLAVLEALGRSLPDKAAAKAARKAAVRHRSWLANLDR